MKRKEDKGGAGVLRVGVINVSDRASRGEYEDLPGKAVLRFLEENVASAWEVAAYAVLPDEADKLSAELCRMADVEVCQLILTTGGTGPALRDVTPEATTVVCEKLLPGFGEAMRIRSLEAVPTAILSRQVAGIRGRSLIINLPGKPKAIPECLEIILGAIPMCIRLLDGPEVRLVT